MLFHCTSLISDFDGPGHFRKLHFMLLGHISTWQNASPGHCFCRPDIWPERPEKAVSDLHLVNFGWLLEVRKPVLELGSLCP